MKTLVSRREVIPRLLLLCAVLCALTIYFPNAATLFFQLLGLAIPATLFLIFKKPQADATPQNPQTLPSILFCLEIAALVFLFDQGQLGIPLLLHKTLLPSVTHTTWFLPRLAMPWGTIALLAGLITRLDRHSTKRVFLNQLYAPLLKTTNDSVFGLLINAGIRTMNAVAVFLSLLFLIVLLLPNTLRFSSFQDTAIAMILLFVFVLLRNPLKRLISATRHHPCWLFVSAVLCTTALIWILHIGMGLHGQTHYTQIPAWITQVPLWEQSYFLTLCWTALWIPWISFYIVIRARSLSLRRMLISILVVSVLISGLLNTDTAATFLRTPLWTGLALFGLCVWMLGRPKIYQTGIDNFLVPGNTVPRHTRSAERFWGLVFLHLGPALVLTLIYGSITLFVFAGFYGILLNTLWVTLPVMVFFREK